MKIAITSKGKTIDSDVDVHFGRCPFFLIGDPQKMNFEPVENNAREQNSGAGIKAAEIIANHDVDGIITGDIGPNAFRALNASGIKIYTGAEGSIKSALKKYKDGKLKETEEPSAFGGSGR